MKTIAVLGSTGSIGTNTLDVVRRNRHLYQVYSLVGGQNIELLTSQILEFRPKLAVVADEPGLGAPHCRPRLAPDCLGPNGPNCFPATRRGSSPPRPPRSIR